MKGVFVSAHAYIKSLRPPTTAHSATLKLLSVEHEEESQTAARPGKMEGERSTHRFMRRSTDQREMKGHISSPIFLPGELWRV